MEIISGVIASACYDVLKKGAQWSISLFRESIKNSAKDSNIDFNDEEISKIFETLSKQEKIKLIDVKFIESLISSDEALMNGLKNRIGNGNKAFISQKNVIGDNIVGDISL